MEEIMQSSAFFIVPIIIAYAIICSIWFIMNRLCPEWWPTENIIPSDTKWKDFIIAILSGILVLLIGQLYSRGYLIPNINTPGLKHFIWPLNNVLIFSPIFISLWIRKQSLATVLISKKGFWKRLGFGLAGSLVGVVAFVGLRGETERIPEIMLKSISPISLSYFPAVFFENVAIAFLFVRIKWVLGAKWAILLPSLLFAFAHVPGSIAEGDPISHIIIFFLLTSFIAVFVLFTCFKARDILWIVLAHYSMDLAIKAF